MLSIQADLSVNKGKESILVKTSESGSLVFIFSSWQIFREALQIRKSKGLSFPEIRSKLKHLSTPLQIKVGNKNAFKLEQGKVKSLSFIAFFKLLQFTIFN